MCLCICDVHTEWRRWVGLWSKVDYVSFFFYFVQQLYWSNRWFGRNPFSMYDLCEEIYVCLCVVWVWLYICFGYSTALCSNILEMQSKSDASNCVRRLQSSVPAAHWILLAAKSRDWCFLVAWCLKAFRRSQHFRPYTRNNIINTKHYSNSIWYIYIYIV